MCMSVGSTKPFELAEQLTTDSKERTDTIERSKKKDTCLFLTSIHNTLSPKRAYKGLFTGEFDPN